MMTLMPVLGFAPFTWGAVMVGSLDSSIFARRGIRQRGVVCRTGARTSIEAAARVEENIPRSFGGGSQWGSAGQQGKDASSLSGGAAARSCSRRWADAGGPVGAMAPKPEAAEARSHKCRSRTKCICRGDGSMATARGRTVVLMQPHMGVFPAIRSPQQSPGRAFPLWAGEGSRNQAPGAEPSASPVRARPEMRRPGCSPVAGAMLDDDGCTAPTSSGPAGGAPLSRVRFRRTTAALPPRPACPP